MVPFPRGKQLKLTVGDKKKILSQRGWLDGDHLFPLSQIGCYDNGSTRTGMLSTCNFGSNVHSLKRRNQKISSEKKRLQFPTTRKKVYLSVSLRL